MLQKIRGVETETDYL